MLEPAIKYKDQLEKLQYDIWFVDKYKYWNCSTYYNTLEIAPDTWNKHQFVSVKDGIVLGYISYSISRADNNVHSLSVINFSNNKIIFGRDLRQALTDIFEKYKFEKINFTVVVGNPIEKTYDKMIKKYGGRIVGTYKKDVKLIDGEYYDRKLYELSAEGYFNTKENKKLKDIKLPIELIWHNCLYYPPLEDSNLDLIITDGNNTFNAAYTDKLGWLNKHDDVYIPYNSLNEYYWADIKRTVKENNNLF